MADVIGRISVPTVLPSAAFPLRTDFGHGRAKARNVIVHQFGDVTGKVEQRFYVGSPATRYTFRRTGLKNSERRALLAFWESMLGPQTPFYYDAPQEDQTFTTITACFENAPLTLNDLADHICSVEGLTLVEIPTTWPTYTINETVTRFPSSTLANSLCDQVQEVIPLVRIRVLEAAVPDICLSDRRVTVGDIDYLPRVLDIGGVRDSNVLVSQNIDGSSDDTQFTLGNADRVMLKLANDTELKKARIELSLYFPLIGTKLDLWAGEIVDWSADKGPS